MRGHVRMVAQASACAFLVLGGTQDRTGFSRAVLGAAQETHRLKPVPPRRQRGAPHFIFSFKFVLNLQPPNLSLDSSTSALTGPSSGCAIGAPAGRPCDAEVEELRLRIGGWKF